MFQIKQLNYQFEQVEMSLMEADKSNKNLKNVRDFLP